MRLCHQTLRGGLSLFEIMDDKGRIVWQGDRRDEVIEVLWAAGVNIPACLLQPSGEFNVELSWESPRVAQSRADLFTYIDGVLSRSSQPRSSQGEAP